MDMELELYAKQSMKNLKEKALIIALYLYLDLTKTC